MGNVFANKILEFIGGYVEFIFVPPFVTEWQQITAEGAVRRERKLVLSKLVCQIKSLDEKIAVGTHQYNYLSQELKTQENKIRATSRSPLGRQEAEFNAANYRVSLETHKSVGHILHLMYRARAQLLIRQHIVSYAGESVLLDTAFGSTGDTTCYVEEFKQAMEQLTKAEVKVDQIMDMVEEEGGFFGNKNKISIAHQLLDDDVLYAILRGDDEEEKDDDDSDDDNVSLATTAQDQKSLLRYSTVPKAAEAGYVLEEEGCSEEMEHGLG